MNRWVTHGVRTLRRVVVGVVGATILLVGAVLVFLPGPALVVVPVGLGVLAIEFAWARRLLKQASTFYPGAQGEASSRRSATQGAETQGAVVDEEY